MGFESFQIEFRGPASFDRVDQFVRRLPHVTPDTGLTTGSSYHVLEDGLHAIELEVKPLGGVSARFTLCHPPSVDAALIDLARRLVAGLEMEVTIRDDVRAEHRGWFAQDRFAEFAAAVTAYAVGRRAEWIAEFGQEPYPARTQEVFSRYVLPRCVPATPPKRG